MSHSASVQKIGLSGKVFLMAVMSIWGLIPAFAYTIRSDHPRLLLNSDDLKLIRNEYMSDGNMESAAVTAWSNMGTPSVKQKAGTSTDHYLRVVAPNGAGVQQAVGFIPNVEYKVTFSANLVSGTFKAQAYQSSLVTSLADVSAPNSGWKTYTTTFTPTAGDLTIRFYGTSTSNEFYINNVSLHPSGERVMDKSMSVTDCAYWQSMDTPTTKEKLNQGGNKRLHIVGGYAKGSYQTLNFKPGQEYAYQISTYLVKGKCRAQLYQNSKLTVLFDLDKPSTGWQTFSGTYIPSEGPLTMRFYGSDTTQESEFYVDDVSFKANGNRVIDGDMSEYDCVNWPARNNPSLREKISVSKIPVLHLKGPKDSGAYQYLHFRPGIPYDYKISVYINQGPVAAQLYQDSGLQVLFNLSGSTSGWQTFTGTFTPRDENLMMRFYSTATDKNTSDFYIKDVSFKASAGVDDNLSPDLGELYRRASTIEGNGSPNPAVSTLAASEWPSTITRTIAFAGMVTQEKRFISLATQYAKAMSTTTGGTDSTQRERLLAIAYVYDWLYDQLSDNDRTSLKNGMVSHIQALENAYHYSTTGAVYTGGHSRACNAAYLGAVVAMYGEYPSGFDGNSLLSTEYNLWTNGYNPFQAWVASKGGYHMGWGYGSGYTSCEPYLIWKSATGEAWGEEWRKQLGSFYYYGLRGDDTFTASGDAWDMKFNTDSVPTCIQSAALGDPYSTDFVNRYNIGGDGINYIWRILYMNENKFQALSSQSIESLPKAKAFGPSGFVIANDSWDNINSTQLIFKSTSFYTVNHHHKDQNSMVLDYKGPLLIDSGDYDSYGTDHWLNYYTRSIAHNTMVVYDPTEQYILWDSKLLTNDGGQQFPAYALTPVGVEPKTLAEAQSAKYALGGVTAFSQDANSCTMTGDATKAYLGSKVASYTRQIKMTYASTENANKPLLNVYDHVALQANKQGLTPKILFHSANTPVINNTTRKVKIENANGGGVEIEVVKPTNVTFTVVGDQSDPALFTVNNGIYRPTQLMPTESGTWRVEVSRTTPGDVDFEFKLKVYDK
ncbi:MAG: heparinase II/III family protein [Verrucomicrobiota bacterium]